MLNIRGCCAILTAIPVPCATNRRSSLQYLNLEIKLMNTVASIAAREPSADDEHVVLRLELTNRTHGRRLTVTIDQEQRM